MNKTTRLEHARQLFLSIASLMGAETKLSGGEVFLSRHSTVNAVFDRFRRATENMSIDAWNATQKTQNDARCEWILVGFDTNP